LSGAVLVTGYGGFLGSAIARRLVALGYRVRGIARQSYPALTELGVEAVRGSIEDEKLCRESVRGVDAIVHTAALAGVWGPRQAYERINVAATQSLITAARDEGVRALVFTSSPSVTFDGSPQSGIDESVPYPQRWLCDYPRTKALAEQEVLRAHEPGRLSVCALRPHLIWGAGDPHLIPRVLARCRAGRLARVGEGTNLIDTVHVENAAQAHVLALERMLDHDRDAGGRPYFITDGEPLGCWEWISTILRCGGLEPPRKRISLPLAYRLGGALELLYRTLGLRDEPPMTRFVALQLGVDHYFSIDSARRRLGYEPAVDRAVEIEELKRSLAS
jgi:nucleoside-diphosphate-sugar epimerase